MVSDDGSDGVGPRSSRQRWALAVGVVLAVVVVAVAVWAWVKVPELYPPYVPPPESPVSAEVAATRDGNRGQNIVTTRASVLAALAGLAALVTIGINFRNSQTNAQTLRTTQDTFRVTERGHLTDRYAKAIEQLGDKDSIAIRLGGIYALQQLAVDTRRDSDQATVVEVLSAFVRLNLRAVPQDPAPATPDNQSAPTAPPSTRPRAQEPQADVLAAISVLAQLPSRIGAPMRADFTGLDFVGIHLGNARLREANLARANLTRVSLAGANLFRANLTGARFVGVDLTGAFLIGATLTNADLRGADLTDTSLIKAELTEAQLSGAHLTQAHLGAADLTRADCFLTDLTKAGLAEANLTGANLMGATLTDANLTNADLTDADLTGANLAGAMLTDANLTNANLTDADLTDAIGWKGREASAEPAREG